MLRVSLAALNTSLHPPPTRKKRAPSPTPTSPTAPPATTRHHTPPRPATSRAQRGRQKTRMKVRSVSDAAALEHHSDGGRAAFPRQCRTTWVRLASRVAATAAAAAAAVPFEPTARGCTLGGLAVSLRRSHSRLTEKRRPLPRLAHEQRLRGCWSRGGARSQGASSAARCSLRPPRRAAGHSCGRLWTRIRLDVGETRWRPARKVPRCRSAVVWFATSRSDPNRVAAAEEAAEGEAAEAAEDRRCTGGRSRTEVTIALPPTGVGPHSSAFCSRMALRHPKRVIAPCRSLAASTVVLPRHHCACEA
mmetsp:Transcript_50192/g.167726  ORF Transcript_50192/g.167726 Transcript_50192/m.167726 type:complete len:305 (-) Transcript_50192:359-1273(-)